VGFMLPSHLQGHCQRPAISVQTIELLLRADLVHVAAFQTALLLALGAHQVSQLATSC